MKSLIILTAVVAVTLAKPGTYRETEDFQYERSATGEGTKAGFYGAQRGNVGGNYEKAHNMDGLAQKQLGDAVKNVQGELGDTNHVGVGNVYTAADTRGVYGQHSFDASSLAGRNFQEGSRFGANSFDSQSSHNAALSSQRAEQYSAQNAAYRKGYTQYQQNAQHNDFSSAGSRQNLHAANQEALDSVHSSQYGGSHGGAYTGSGYQGQGAYDYRHNSRSESQREEQSAYGSNSETRYAGGNQRTENAYGSAQTRLVDGGPVRISIRPGSTVTIPVAVETFDDSQRSYDANSINTDAEVIGIAPKTNAKGYESSYRYQKSWEKHDGSAVAVPLAIPTPRPYPESYTLTGSQGMNAANSEFVGGASNSQNHYKGYNTASASQSQYQSGYNAQEHQRSGSQSNAYRGSQNLLQSNAALTNVDLGVEAVTPKSYQSKYSYHKAWERQGDPYVIVPAGGSVDTSQRLVAANQAYRSQNYNAHSSHGQGVECDC